MERVGRLLGILRRRGLLRGEEIQRELGISQPVMSRLMREAGSRVFRFGRSVATRYPDRQTVHPTATNGPEPACVGRGGEARDTILGPPQRGGRTQRRPPKDLLGLSRHRGPPRRGASMTPTDRTFGLWNHAAPQAKNVTSCRPRCRPERSNCHVWRARHRHRVRLAAGAASSAVYYRL